MNLTPEQVIAANKANLETLMGLTNKAFSGVEQLIELNMVAAKAAMADSAPTPEVEAGTSQVNMSADGVIEVQMP